jgi:hypothetical protein
MDDQRIENAALPLAKLIFGALGVAAVFVGIVFGARPLSFARIPAAYVLVGGLFLEIFLIYEFSRRGRGPVPIFLLITGWAYVLGGIGLDVGMTLVKTPDLALESNLVARVFLDSGYPLQHIRIFAFVAQVGLAVMACVAWAAFLRHRGTLVALALALRPQTFNEFTNAAVRGVLRPTPLISRAGITFPRFNWYRLGCLALVAWVGSHLYRWYCGLEWAGLVPARRPVIAIVAGSVGVAYFYLWLWFEYRHARSADPLKPEHLAV